MTAADNISQMLGSQKQCYGFRIYRKQKHEDYKKYSTSVLFSTNHAVTLFLRNKALGVSYAISSFKHNPHL